MLYAYMGVYPKSYQGGLDLLAYASQLTVMGGASHLIVKTPAEAHRVPSVEENLASLRYSDAVAVRAVPALVSMDDSTTYLEAKTLIDAVLSLADDVGNALSSAFNQGVLDIPYCLHPDNMGLTRSRIDAEGRLIWSDVGRTPLVDMVQTSPNLWQTVSGLLGDLCYMQCQYDSRSSR